MMFGELAKQALVRPSAATDGDVDGARGVLGRSVLPWIIFPTLAIFLGYGISAFVHTGQVMPSHVAPEAALLWLIGSLLVGFLLAVVWQLFTTIEQLRATKGELAERAAEQQLLEDRLRRVIDSIAVFIVVTDPDGVIIEVNQAAARAAGLSEAALLGKRVERTLWWAGDAESSAEVRAKLAMALEGVASRLEVRSRLRDDRMLTMDVLLSPVRDATGRVDRLVISGTDVSSREQAQRALQRSERAIREIIETVPGVVYQASLDPSGKREFRFMSSRIRDYIGLEAVDAMRDLEAFNALLDPATIPELTAKIEASRLALTPFQYDFVFNTEMGKRWLRAQSTPHREPDGTVVWNGVMTDITQLKQIEAKLQESQRRFELAVSGATEGLWELHYGGGQNFFSDRFREMIGYVGREVPAGQEFFETLIHPDDHQRVRDGVRDHLDRGEPYDSEFRLRTTRGFRWVRSRGMSERDASGKPVRFAGSIVDIDDKKRIEVELRSILREQERLLQREHTLLRELNHRVRNNLAGLLGLVNLYQRSSSSVKEVGEAIRGKVFALRQVHDLISEQAGSTIDLGKLVRCMAEAIVPAPARARFEAAGRAVALPAAQASALGMVVQELLTNSVKHGALAREGGRVELAWEATAVSEREAGVMRGPMGETLGQSGVGTVVERGQGAHGSGGEHGLDGLGGVALAGVWGEWLGGTDAPGHGAGSDRGSVPERASRRGDVQFFARWFALRADDWAFARAFGGSADGGAGTRRERGDEGWFNGGAGGGPARGC